METIKHKFKEKDFGQGFITRNAILETTPYKPEVLFLGTFNPDTDEVSNKADFFYGRNWFWPALFNLFEFKSLKYIKQRKFHTPLEPTLKQILEFSSKHKLTFADLIQEIEISKETKYKIVKNKVFIEDESFDLINDGDLSKLNNHGQVVWSTENVITYLRQNETIKSVYLTRKPCEPFLTEWKKIMEYDFNRKINFYKIFTPSGQGLKGSPRISSLIKHWAMTNDTNYDRIDNDWLQIAKIDYNSTMFDSSDITKPSKMKYIDKAIQNIDPKMNSVNKLGENKNNFDVKIGKTYYDQGFFNIPQKFEKYFESDGAELILILGNYESEIVANINRTANPNKMPRIMAGKKYTSWIQENFSIGDVLKIEIISNTKIKLAK